MILAIDFDDTLHNRRNVRRGQRMGPPEPGAVISMQRLFNQGHRLIIFTGRSVDKPTVYKAVADWLEFFHIPYHEITNIKRANMDLYIDNRAIHYNSWPQAMAKLTQLQQSPTYYYDFIKGDYREYK